MVEQDHVDKKVDNKRFNDDSSLHESSDWCNDSEKLLAIIDENKMVSDREQKMNKTDTVRDEMVAAHKAA